MDELTTPVALFVYRRPEHTERVVERITEAEPPRVLVVGDGPADGGEEEQVEAVRRVIAETDWECEVKTNYAESNLGLKERFATGLDWVFGEAAEAIILEDDTLPVPSFFRFCDELLDRFRGDERVWDITGRNELVSYCPGGYSYLYSHYGGIWGWATWRSMYEEYDPDMTAWENPVVQERIGDLLYDSSQVQYMEKVFEKTHNGEIETWDYQWGFARMRNNAVSIVPEKNLVRNVGFGDDATNTKGSAKAHGFAGKQANNLEFPLSHPPFVGIDRHYESNLHAQRQSKSNTPQLLNRVSEWITSHIR